jgi:hypothetical protein
MGASEWGWDLIKHKAIPWDERGPGEQVLGPYPTREAAVNWRSKVEQRNEIWDGQDEAWNEDPDQN